MVLTNPHPIPGKHGISGFCLRSAEIAVEIPVPFGVVVGFTHYSLAEGISHRD
jgi:hypothetical protein